MKDLKCISCGKDRGYLPVECERCGSLEILARPDWLTLYFIYFPLVLITSLIPIVLLNTAKDLGVILLAHLTIGACVFCCLIFITSTYGDYLRLTPNGLSARTFMNKTQTYNWSDIAGADVKWVGVRGKTFLVLLHLESGKEIRFGFMVGLAVDEKLMNDLLSAYKAKIASMQTSPKGASSCSGSAGKISETGGSSNARLEEPEARKLGTRLFAEKLEQLRKGEGGSLRNIFPDKWARVDFKNGVWSLSHLFDDGLIVHVSFSAHGSKPNVFLSDDYLKEDGWRGFTI